MVAPGAPMAPAAVGWKPSASQPVGVITKVRSEKPSARPTSSRGSATCPRAHEVGIRMNGPLLAWPLKVSAIFVIWIGMPPASRGWSAKVDSSP